MKRAVGSWYTSARSWTKLDACMPGVSIDHESSHNASVSAAPGKICRGTKSGSGPTESAATVRSGNTSYAFIALRGLLGIMPFHISHVCFFCFYISLTTREFNVEKPEVYLKRNPSYNGFGNQSLAVSFRKSPDTIPWRSVWDSWWSGTGTDFSHFRVSPFILIPSLLRIHIHLSSILYRHR